MDALSATKHWLTVGVTASPAFKVRNLIRDSLQAISVSDLSYNPIANMKDGIKASARDSQTYVSALASGGLIRFGTMMEGNGPERVRRLVPPQQAHRQVVNVSLAAVNLLPIVKPHRSRARRIVKTEFALQ